MNASPPDRPSTSGSIGRSLAAVADPEINSTLVGLVFDPDGGTDPDRTASYAVGAATGSGQRFRVLRPHAQGGLGAVFVARDEELHREVALKQLLDRHADDTHNRARFLVEAEITGKLEHPGSSPSTAWATTRPGVPSTPCGSSRVRASRRPSLGFTGRSARDATRPQTFSRYAG